MDKPYAYMKTSNHAACNRELKTTANIKKHQKERPKMTYTYMTRDITPLGFLLLGPAELCSVETKLGHRQVPHDATNFFEKKISAFNTEKQQRS